MNTRELIAKHNALATKLDQPLLSSWKNGKDKLEARILALEEDLEKAEKEKLAKAPAEKPAKKSVVSGPTIRQVSAELLLAVAGIDEKTGRKIGLPYDDILQRVHQAFPGCETSVKCLRWYAAHMNREPGIQMPIRPRQRPEKKA